MENINTENPNLILNLDSIAKLKGMDRQKAIITFSNALYHFLKENNYKVVKKDFLKSFIENGSIRTQQRTFKFIIDDLITKNKLALTTKSNDRIRFQKKDLLTFDYDSYKILMDKNGFKTYVSKWIKTKGNFPKKVLIGKYPINSIDTDISNRNIVIENKSSRFVPYHIKSKSYGCFSNTSKSLVKTNSQYSIKAYLVL